MTSLSNQMSGYSPFTRAVKTKYSIRKTDNFLFSNRRFQFSARRTIFLERNRFKIFSFKGNDHADVAADVENKQNQVPLSSLITSAPAIGVKSQTLEREESNSVLQWFTGRGAIFTIPLVIFISWYGIIKIMYGIEVARELTPLWILGPIITVLYIKAIRWIFSLYVISLNKGVDILLNFPSYYAAANGYLMQWKLRGGFCLRLLKKEFCEELSRERMERLREWTAEIYLDCVEFIWPLHCRTLRFLKKANLV